jgi:hypothetical protein
VIGLPVQDRAPPRERVADRLVLFSVLWALAHGFHVVGNPSLAPGWAQALLALTIGLVLLHPGHVGPLAAMAAVGVAMVWLEAPLLANHWLLVGFVDLAILVAVGVGLARRRPLDRADLAQRALPAARLCLLGFYAFAAFAKLNAGFFDRSVSCAVYFFRESTESIGLSGLQLGGAAWLEHTVIVATAAIELSIPLLLVLRRTRHLGVVLALSFHWVLALDRTHQFFDFSSVLTALFVLFLPVGFARWVGQRTGSVDARLALRHQRLPELVRLGLVAAAVAPLLMVAVARIPPRQGIELGWAPFLVLCVGLIVAVVRYLMEDRPVATERLLPHHPVFLLVPLLVVANGLTPYLEVKTGYGWNMYANLRTVDGDTNHYLLPGSLPLTDEQGDVVEILETDDTGLDVYRETGYGLTFRQLRTHLSGRPETSITFRRDGEVVALERAADLPELVEPVPAWREKIQLFRAVDLRSPPERCVPVWGPAR